MICRKAATSRIAAVTAAEAAAAAECRSAAAGSASAPSSFWASSAMRSASTRGCLIGGAEILTGGSQQQQQTPRQPQAPHRHAERRHRALCRTRARQHRSAVEGHFPKEGQTYRRAAAGDVLGHDALGLRRGAERHGAVLLPERSRGLSRHRVLQRSRAALPRLQRQGLQVFARLCDRPRGRPSRAEPARHPAARCSSAAAGLGPRRSQPHAGAGRAAGRLLRRRLGQSARRSSDRSSSRATSTRRCKPLRRSATTCCRRRSQGTVVPDSFTHGSSEQRKRWFMTGFQEGTVKACNTFAAARL